jgi:hypothetical protein
MTEPGEDTAPREGAKAPWERPTLTLLGDVQDLVRGATKQSGNADSDGTSVRKPPLVG